MFDLIYIIYSCVYRSIWLEQRNYILGPLAWQRKRDVNPVAYITVHLPLTFVSGLECGVAQGVIYNSN